MKKVLLIDDDHNILTTLQIHLEDAGITVLSAENGKKGLELFEREKPEIVFLDLKLPDIDGLQVLNKIAGSEIKTYVIIITAYATIDTAVKAIKMGAFDYLPKPFTPEQITHHLKMISKVNGLESEVETLKNQLKEIVMETLILLRIEHFQQGRGRVAMGIPAHFVDLVQHEDRVGGFGLLQVLDDPARHGTDIGLPVSPDLGLVMQAAQ